MDEKIQKNNVESDRSASDQEVTQELRQSVGSHNTIHSLCLILPFHNEQENLADFVLELVQAFADGDTKLHILLVDDGSTDSSLPIAKKLSNCHNQISYLSFSRNFGKETAIMAGLIECGDNYDAVAYMDSDGQHTTSDLLRLVEEARSPTVDLVCGVRTDRDYQSPLQRRMAKAFYSIFRSISQAPIDEGAGDFNVLKMPVVQVIRRMTEPHPFMKAIVGWVGFRKKLVPINIVPRAGGTPKSSTTKMLKLAFGAFVSFSSWPLRVWSAVGMMSSLLAVGYLLLVVFNTMIFGIDVPGYATTIVLLLGIGGLQLLSVGIIGEYVARIYDASKNRPRYIIAQRSDNK